MIDPLLDYPFEMFCEFYENGGIEEIDWNSDEGHRNAKSEMDYLYKWFTIDRKERELEIGTVSETWCEHHVSWWENIPDNDSCYTWVFVPKNKYAEYLFTIVQDLEINYENEKEVNLIRLVKIRNYLWT